MLRAEEHLGWVGGGIQVQGDFQAAVRGPASLVRSAWPVGKGGRIQGGCGGSGGGFLGMEAAQRDILWDREE